MCKPDSIKLEELCVRFRSLSCDNTEYKQYEGLAMGSLLGVVMASLFMEMLKSEHCSRIL